MILARLFYEFFKAGLFAIGGGLATLPFLNTMGISTGWFTPSGLADMLAISESTPGPIGVNMATYAGFTTAGIPGALAATLGLVTPSVVIILLVARALTLYNSHPLVRSALYGLRPASLGLIAAAGFGVLQLSLLNLPLYRETGEILRMFQWKALVLAPAVFLILKKWKPHPILVIALSAAAGVIFRFAGA